MKNIPYFKEIKTLDEGAHLTRELVYRQKVEIEELTEIDIARVETIREQQRLMDEMMAVIKHQDKTLSHALLLIILAWAYAFFSIAWCI